MKIYAIEEYRTDTSKPGSFGLFGTWDEYEFTYDAVYISKEKAEKIAAKMNEQVAPYDYRYRVLELDVEE